MNSQQLNKARKEIEKSQPKTVQVKATLGNDIHVIRNESAWITIKKGDKKLLIHKMDAQYLINAIKDLTP